MQESQEEQTQPPMVIQLWIDDEARTLDRDDHLMDLRLAMSVLVVGEVMREVNQLRIGEVH